MAAQAVDAALVSAAQGLSGAVSGGSNSVNVQEPLRETGAKSKTTRTSFGVKTRIGLNQSAIAWMIHIPVEAFTIVSTPQY